MKDELKAQEIIGCNRENCLECGGSLSVANGCVQFRRIMEMAAWKDKQFSDRVEMTLCIDCHEFESCDNCPKYQIKKELLKL